MRRSFPLAALVSLIAISASGCASQNAMSLVPADVRMAMAADAARKQADADKPVEAAADASATKKKPAAGGEKGPDLAALRKLADGARDGEPLKALPEKPEPTASYAEDRTGSETDPAILLEQALEAQNGVASAAENDPESTGPADDDAWNRMLAMQKEAAPATDATTTAALGSATPVGESVSVAFAGEGVALDRDSDLHLRLMKSGGLGRIAGASGGEALEKASARGRQIAAIAGGDPGISYDPALPAGSATVYFAPSARRI